MGYLTAKYRTNASLKEQQQQQLQQQQQQQQGQGLHDGQEKEHGRDTRRYLQEKTKEVKEVEAETKKYVQLAGLHSIYITIMWL